ncbi:MAG: hypothetical protein GY865_11850, partial [candidate division Zixibacteria bacterium]|nr:hypothetical protein [candidate division Zixibacteria bacterium]
MKYYYMLSIVLIWIIISNITSFSADLNNTDEMIYQTDPSNLYKVDVNSIEDANNLRNMGAKPALRISGGYLVFLKSENEELLSNSGLFWELIVTDISRAQLALDMNRDGSNIDRYPLIYQEGELRLFRANIDEIEKT